MNDWQHFLTCIDGKPSLAIIIIVAVTTLTNDSDRVSSELLV